MSSDNPISAAQSSNSSDSKSVAKSCPVSGQSVAIVPVRYAIDDMDEKGNQLNPFPEKGNWQGPFKLKHAKYTMRRLRDGWLYVYDEDAETFHEYQVQGANLIKYDWGSDESTKEASERGSAGDSKVYLSYPAKHTLFLGFSYHRWTWRVCEHMRSESADRKKWMRKLDLNDYCHSDSLYNHHAGYYEGLVDAVADIAAEGQTIDSNMFSNTCTPFSIDQEQQESNDTEADDDSLEVKISADTEKANKKIQEILDDYPLLKEKNYASICDYALPENTSGLFIALDDKQADICDLMCLLNIAWADKQIILGDDTVKRKIMIGEIVRSLACVPVPEAFRKKHEQLEPDVVIAAESRLNYLLGKYQNRSYQYDSTASGSMGIVGMQRNQVTSPKLAKEISDFEKDFFKITEDMKEQYRKITEDSKIHKQAYLYKGVIEDFEWSTEVDKNSDGLYDFLQKIYREANKKDPNIKKRFIDLAATTEQLGDDLLILGYDSEKVDNTTYYLSLFSSVLETLSNSVVDDEQKKYLNKIISFDKPRNLLALMPAAGSKEVWNALDDFLLPLKEQLHVLDSNNAGDWQTGFGSGLDITSVFGDEQAIQIKWFSALAVPVKNTITALQALVQSSIGKLIWSGLSSTIFSVQMVKAPLNIARYLMANSIAQKQNLIAVKNYQELDEKFRKELKKVLSDFKIADSNLKAARGEIGDIEKNFDDAKKNYENSVEKKDSLKLQDKIDKLNSDLKSLPDNDGPNGAGVSRKTESEAKKINRKIKDFKKQLSQLDAEISSNKLEYERQQALSDKLKQIKANAAQNKNLIKVYEDELKEISDELAKLKATQPLPLQLVDENLNKEYRTALYKKFKVQLGLVKDKAKVVVSDQVMGGVFIAINLWKFVVVGAAYQAKNDENDSFDAADRELTYVGIWTINSAASFLSIPQANIILNNKDLYEKTFSKALSYSLSSAKVGQSEINLLKSFRVLTRVIAITGMMASYYEWSESSNLISDNGMSGMGQLGAIIKTIGLTGQLAGFYVQALAGFDFIAIGSAFLGPIAIFIGAAAILYLVGSILINVFELAPIESWVRKSIWGIEPEPEWKNNPWLELRTLEEIYYKPKVELNLIFTKNTNIPESVSFGSNGFHQYDEISVTLPKYLKDRKVTIEILSSEYGGNKKTNYLLDESNGTLSQNIDTGEFIYKIHCQPARVYSVGIRIPSILEPNQTIAYIGNGMILPSDSAMYSAGYRLPGIVGEKLNLAKHRETTNIDLKFEEMSEIKVSNILHQVMVKTEG